MISPPLIEKVLRRAQETASHSWEYSTVYEALLEYHTPSLSIFSSPFPNQEVPVLDGEQVQALEYIKPFIRTNTTTLCDGNGSSADPASLGIPALLVGKTSKADHDAYSKAVSRQLNHLLHTVPRHANGAISHREDAASLWADFVYMVPPFLAFYGVFTDDVDTIREAVRQCELYRDVLSTATRAWKHIVNAQDGAEGLKDDSGLWSTSNGWVAAGMARVLATLQKSRFAGETADEQASLLKMIQQILDGVMVFDTDSSGLLRNYLDDETWWGEVSGTALLAATTFRMAVLKPGIFGTTYTNWAVRKMEVVSCCIDETTGIAQPFVNPLKEGQKTPLEGVSPEGQAFVVLMFAAWRDWNGDMWKDS
ncbi:Six-hairpin glycosidase [Dothidotthia symphoricarpi CBS 119687]|uniref:Six-hairpin glycosidase n=1 Tax=Dothidotthia symphoricarpi CBS 119687 TaxID=1392245 RepID=A0A6A6ALI8_9PLEO|nr:Six-hairpin glycosidase [Dothidotthia symphoricarpi CBS 119687]KAF2132670.1 Six-hairpin glycosidase [Dothidotthia symphoricarpi CBS 119687]